MKLGLKIKQARDFREMSQLDLSQKSGVSRASIQLYEADKGNITIANLEKIANALEFGLEYFLDLSPSMSLSQEKLSPSMSLSQSSPQESINHQKVVHQSVHQSSKSCPSPQDLSPNHQKNVSQSSKKCLPIHPSPQDLSLSQEKNVHKLPICVAINIDIFDCVGICMKSK